MRAANESYALKMNTIVIVVSKIHILHPRLAFVKGIFTNLAYKSNNCLVSAVFNKVESIVSAEVRN